MFGVHGGGEKPGGQEVPRREEAGVVEDAAVRALPDLLHESGIIGFFSGEAKEAKEGLYGIEHTYGGSGKTFVEQRNGVLAGFLAVKKTDAGLVIEHLRGTDDDGVLEGLFEQLKKYAVDKSSPEITVTVSSGSDGGKILNRMGFEEKASDREGKRVFVKRA